MNCGHAYLSCVCSEIILEAVFTCATVIQNITIRTHTAVIPVAIAIHHVCMLYSVVCML